MLFIGDGPLRHELITLIDSYHANDIVFHIPYTDLVFDYVSSSSGIFITSDDEATPNVLLEALACRKPVLISNCSSSTSYLSSLSTLILVFDKSAFFDPDLFVSTFL